MLMYNNGYFTAKTEQDMAMLISIINTETNIFLRPRMMSDAWYDESSDEWELEVSEVFGYLDEDLDTVAKRVTEEGLNVSFDIDYFGDEEGRHVFKDGVFNTYSKEECTFRDADDETIREEAERRNLISKEEDSSETPHDELWEVTGLGEYQDLTFAICTSEEIAKAAADTIIKADIGYDEDSITVTKSKIRLNQVIIDGREINLNI